MLMGSLLEGGWTDPFPAGDHGTSFGPFQIHLPAHPGVSSGQANDPTFAVNYMLAAYRDGVQRAGGAATAEQAARAAFYAERPAAMYSANRYNSLWSQVTAAMSGAPIGGAGGGDPTASDSSGIPGVLRSIFQPMSDFFTALKWLVNPVNWLRILLGAVGAGFLLGGTAIFASAV